jgi:hypothetical protein
VVRDRRLGDATEPGRTLLPLDARPRRGRPLRARNGNRGRDRMADAGRRPATPLLQSRRDADHRRERRLAARQVALPRGRGDHRLAVGRDRRPARRRPDAGRLLPVVGSHDVRRAPLRRQRGVALPRPRLSRRQLPRRRGGRRERHRRCAARVLRLGAVPLRGRRAHRHGALALRGGDRLPRSARALRVRGRAQRDRVVAARRRGQGLLRHGHERHRRREGRLLCRRRDGWPARLVLRPRERHDVPARSGRRHPPLRRLPQRSRARAAARLPHDARRLRPPADAERLRPPLVVRGVRFFPLPRLHRLR